MEATQAAPGVDYFDYPGIDARFFRCEPYRATLSTTACAKRWTEAQSSAGDVTGKFAQCCSCPIGAAHAGRRFVAHSILFGAMFCPRHRDGTTRMIGDELCVSCYNRQREFVLGRNAKGTKPVKADLQPRAIRFAIKHGAVAEFRKTLSADTVELMFTLLRRMPGEVVFGFSGRSPAVRQGVLF